jgi:hypothetical protein
MRLSRHHAHTLELSDRELNLVIKAMNDDDMTSDEEREAFELGAKLRHAYDTSQALTAAHKERGAGGFKGWRPTPEKKLRPGL